MEIRNQSCIISAEVLFGGVLIGFEVIMGGVFNNNGLLVQFPLYHGHVIRISHSRAGCDTETVGGRFEENAVMEYNAIWCQG